MKTIVPPWHSVSPGRLSAPVTTALGIITWHTVVCSGAPGEASLGFPRWLGPPESKGLRKLNQGVHLSAFKMHMPWGQSLCRYYPAVRSEKHLENRLLLPELTTWLKPTCRLTTAETIVNLPALQPQRSLHTHPCPPLPASCSLAPLFQGVFSLKSLS